MLPSDDLAVGMSCKIGDPSAEASTASGAETGEAGNEKTEEAGNEKQETGESSTSAV